MQEPEKEARGFLGVILKATAIVTFTVVLGCPLFLAFLSLPIGMLTGILTGNYIAAVISLLMVMVGIYAVYSVIRSVIRRGFEMRWLAIEGVETVGTITRKIKFPRRWYQVKYAYYDSFGNVHHHTLFVSRETYYQLEVGSPVKVVYLPHQPAVSGLHSHVELVRRALERKT